MVTYKFNQAYYELKFSGLDEGVVQVVSFEAEEKISDLYEYKIELISEDPSLDASKILNKPATFLLNRGDENPIKVHGIISDFEQYSRTPDYVFYRAVLVPRIWRLSLVYQNEIYQDMDIKDVIEDVLKDIGITAQDYKVELKNSYPKMEYIVQYRETNLNFLNRRLEHFGIYYYFEHSGDKDIIVFTDSNSKLPSLESAIGYNINKDPLSENESISEIMCREKVVTGMVQLKDYNYMFPEKHLMVQSQMEDTMPGLYYDFGDNFENEKDGESLAKTRNQEFISQKKRFFGNSDCRLFKAGSKFKIEKHYREDWNSEYVLTSVKSKGTQQNLFGIFLQSNSSPTYENNFEAIPSNIEFRPVRKTPIPKITGVMSARIEGGSPEDEIYIDDLGRYKAKMFFDLSDKTNGEATLPIRLTQNYSGSGYGTHLVNRVGTEFVWTCFDGNIDRPIGLGTIPNPSNASPTTSSNKTQNIIRTASGNEFLMDDKSKEGRISLTTPDANKILFDDKDDKIEVTTKDKHKVLMDDKNQNITVTSKDGHTILMDDKNTRIEIKSKNGHFIIINDKAGEEKIQLSDKPGNNNFIIDITNQKLVVETKDGSIDILAPKGEVKIKSKTLKIETEGDTSLKAANIKSEAKGDFGMAATNIKQEAKMDFKQKGNNITAEATMDNKVKGLNVTTEAGVNMQVKGTLVTVQSTGPNTIKGLPVQIN
ncbi:MAG TPA: type VI secretion system tip protein TssI/VgrG [Ignavibacteriaceae bacterium]|nr:type VI secretion system tip protein TssI/VgrG [Ignavibacteriaceae bacterium]